MKKRNIPIKIMLSLILIMNIYLYKFNLKSNKNYNLMCLKNINNYKDNYEEMLKSYDLINDKFDFIPAKANNLSINKINNLFMLNKGKNDKVKENSFVVNEDGLVGIIKKVYNDKSLVKLISSNNTKISIETNECYGSLNVSKNKAVISDLVNCDNVEIGDLVYTSKYSYSASNILIGKIINIKNSKLYIKFSFNPYKIKYVGVINDSV